MATMVPRRFRASREVFGVNGREAPIMSGIHGLEHVHGFRASDLPTMIRSGRIRRELMTRDSTVTSPFPSTFGGRASRRTTWGWFS